MIRPVVLITPGAGTDANHASLVAIEDEILGRADGAVIRRMDFAYRLAGKRAPDKAPVLIEAVRAGVEALAADAGVIPNDVIIGGRSMGGRMCSIAAAQGLNVRALFCISYPLHPPGKPDRLRVEHFPTLTVPTIFVSGTRDSFGTRAEFERETPAIGGPFEHLWIEGGDHSLTRHGALAAGMVADWITQLRPRD